LQERGADSQEPDMGGERRIRRDAGVVWLLLSGIFLAVSAMAWADTTPAAFNFRDVTVADQGSVVSHVVTVRGIDEPTLMQVKGDSTGRFQINGGTWRSGSATVNAGDRIRLRLTSRAASDPGGRALTVAIGDASDQWRVITRPLDCTQPARGTVYEVGPGRTYASIGAVPWERLGAGDRVRIHARTAPYREKILLSNAGTAAAPISVCGVGDAQGRRPVIDGKQATTRPGMRSLFQATQRRGVITVTLDQSDSWGQKPQYVIIEGLEVRGANTGSTFTDDAGNTAPYPDNAAGIYVERGEHITIRNCLITKNGNGVFVASGDSEAVLSRNILVEGNTFIANSVVGRDREHHSYIEAAGVVYQYNRYRNTRAGAFGGALKDRSAGTVIRYNWIEGGARALDLVEAEDSFRMVGRLPAYRSTWVYGNIINLRGEDSASTVHYGGDSGVFATYRKGTLYFYHNTVVYRVDRSERYHATIFDIETNDETAEIWNNVFHVQRETVGADPTFLFMARGAGVHHFGVNLVSPGIDDVRNPAAWGETFEGTITGWNRRIASPGNNPGFTNLATDHFRPLRSSAAVDSGTPAPVHVPANRTVTRQYRRHLGTESRPVNGATRDLGAFEAR
jgi:hypothetical protein